MAQEDNNETTVEDHSVQSGIPADAVVADAADISSENGEIADVEAQSPEGPGPVKKTNGWGLAAAAFIAVGVTVTLMQGITALMLGTSQYYDWRLSSGGLLAVGVAIYIGVRCSSWAEWRKRIWPWLVLAGAVAAVLTFVQSSQVDGNTEDLPLTPTSAFISKWEKTDSLERREAVQKETGSVLIDFTEIKICHVGQLWTDCIDHIVADYERACQRQDISEATPRYLSGSPLSPEVTACEHQLNVIKEMQNVGGADYAVVTPGTTKLVVTPEVEWVSVVAEPKKSHVATCILGFIGECE